MVVLGRSDGVGAEAQEMSATPSAAN
jgi:hypothetical protein